MSAESDKVLGINRLPVFPLPLVLMPHEMLPLHIFEPRYRQLLEDISHTNKLFGLSLFEPENEFQNRPQTNTIGCVAEVRESKELEDGRSNILTVGVIRYRLLEYLETDDPYLVAKVEFFEDEDEVDPNTEALSKEVFLLFKRVAQAAHNLSGQRGEFPDIPEAAPEQLSFLVSAAFNLPPEEKYEYLEMTSTRGRLKKVHGILSESVKQVEESAKIDKISRTNGHANKKIDLGP
ncbi:MAG: hypothetical protein HKN33_16015 [Pyrinomonadaceae bacterium]|nr:hypothetical protein [Pyrinomonadaceae bacterium]